MEQTNKKLHDEMNAKFQRNIMVDEWEDLREPESMN